MEGAWGGGALEQSHRTKCFCGKDSAPKRKHQAQEHRPTDPLGGWPRFQFPFSPRGRASKQSRRQKEMPSGRDIQCQAGSDHTLGPSAQAEGRNRPCQCSGVHSWSLTSQRLCYTLNVSRNTLEGVLGHLAPGKAIKSLDKFHYAPQDQKDISPQENDKKTGKAPGGSAPRD